MTVLSLIKQIPKRWERRFFMPLAIVVALIIGGILTQTGNQPTSPHANNAKQPTDKQVASAQTAQGSQQQGSNATPSNSNIGQSQTSSNKPATNKPTPTDQPPKPATKSLKFSKNSVTFGAGESGTFVDITAETGTKLVKPTFTSLGGVITFIQPPQSNNEQYKAEWTAQFSRISPSQNGQGYVTFTAQGLDGITYTGKILVSWPAVPYFYVGQGALTKTFDGDYVTLTANFTLQPGPNFGNPVIRMAMSSDQGCMIVPSTVLNRTITYSGQNDYSLSCTMYKSTLEMSSGFWIRVNLIGDYVGGGGSLTYLATP